MAFQYGVLLVMISIFPKLTSYRKNKLGKSITTSTEGPLVDLPPTKKDF